MSAAGSEALVEPSALAESVLAAADARADAAVVIVDEDSQVEVRYANNTTTTNGVRLDRRITMICIRETAQGQAVGIARRSGNVDIDELVRSALADADGSPPAEDASPLLAPGEASTAAGATTFDRPPGATDPAILEGVLRGLSGAFGRARAGHRVLAGFAEHTVDTTYLVTSAGVRLRHEQATGALQLVGRSTDGTASAWAGVGSPDFAGVSLEALEERLVRRLEVAANKIDLPAGRYETILPPDSVADLMAYLVESTGGRDAHDGQSVFSGPDGTTRVGEVLSELPFELRSDPAEPGLECCPFLATPVSGADVSVFDNGLPVGRTAWVEDGRLSALQYHRAGARRYGDRPRTIADNLVLELPGAAGSIEDLVATTGRGLLLTCLWYIREVDPATLLLTGLTRDGVYLVEDGAIRGAVNNFRFNESPVDLLGRVTEAGASVRALGREFGEWMNRTAMPPLRLPDFNMSSVSPAS